MLRRALIISLTLFAAVATMAARLPKISPAPPESFPTLQEILSDVSKRAVSSIEGVWQLVPEGVTLLIEPWSTLRPGEHADSYRIIVIKSGNRAVRPGTLLGEIIPGGNASLFEARIYSRFNEGHYYLPRKYVIKFDDALGRFELQKQKNRLSINLWHIVPFLWRNSVKIADNDKAYVPGAVRICPRPSKPVNPVYL